MKTYPYLTQYNSNLHLKRDNTSGFKRFKFNSIDASSKSICWSVVVKTLLSSWFILGSVKALVSDVDDIKLEHNWVLHVLVSPEYPLQ